MRLEGRSFVPDRQASVHLVLRPHLLEGMPTYCIWLLADLRLSLLWIFLSALLAYQVLLTRLGVRLAASHLMQLLSGLRRSLGAKSPILSFPPALCPAT